MYTTCGKLRFTSPSLWGLVLLDRDPVCTYFFRCQAGDTGDGISHQLAGAADSAHSPQRFRFNGSDKIGVKRIEVAVKIFAHDLELRCDAHQCHRDVFKTPPEHAISEPLRRAQHPVRSFEYSPCALYRFHMLV